MVPVEAVVTAVTMVAGPGLLEAQLSPSCHRPGADRGDSVRA